MISAAIKPQAMNGSLTHFRFLDLPKDIRFMIYEYLVVSRIQPATPVAPGFAYEMTKLHLGVIQVSRQIHEEVHRATYQRRMGKLALYFTDHYDASKDLLRILATAYGSEEHSLEGEDINEFTVLNATEHWNPSPTLVGILYTFFYKLHFSSIAVAQGGPIFEIQRLRSSARAFLEYAMMRFRHSVRVEYRFMIWASRDNGLYRSPLPSQVTETGDSPLKPKSALICANQWTRDLVVERQHLQNPNCLPVSSATTEEMAYMCATMVDWATNQPV